MLDLSQILSSRAHFKVLETVARSGGGLRLRQMADLSQMHVHSIENALKDLNKKKVILVRKENSIARFHLNELHPAANLLCKIFKLIQVEENRAFANKVSSRIPGYLKFLDSSNQLFSRIKRETTAPDHTRSLRLLPRKLST